MNFGKSKVVEPTPNQTEAISPCSLHEVLSRPGPVSIIELVETCIEEAHILRASDIHINPTETEVEIRLRIDGVLHDKCRFSKTILPEVISRIKVLSHLRSDEHQAAQDGRFRMTTKAGCGCTTAMAAGRKGSSPTLKSCSKAPNRSRSKVRRAAFNR